MTHRYTLLVGGTVLPGPGQPPTSAVAWAEGTILALGSDEEVRGVSRGDSHIVNLGGAFVVPVGLERVVSWPPSVALEIGGPADLAVLLEDPRVGGDGPRLAIGTVRGGHLVSGSLPSQRPCQPTSAAGATRSF